MTTTTTTTIVATVTHIATVLANVELQVDETSTVVSTVVVTASDIDTATDVTYTTTTVAVAKRGLPTPSPVGSLDLRQDSVPSTSLARFSSLLARLTGRAPNDDDSLPLSPFAPRFDPAPWTYQKEPRSGIIVARATTSTVTSTVTVTITTDVTSTVSSTATTLITSVDLITSIQTRTRYVVPSFFLFGLFS